MTGTFAGFSLALGLAGLAGFRAFYPLVIVSLVASFSDKAFFRPPFQLLSSTWIIIILLLFLVVEVLLARVPSEGNLVDFAEIVAKIVSGAFLFSAVFSGVGVFGGLFFGGLLAGLGAVIKALLRPFLIGVYDGMNLSLLTTIEDLIAFAGTILVILIPAVSIILVSYIIYLAFKRFNQQKKQGQNKKVRVLR